jgi:cytochrome c-type biogenesis protein CcmE
MDSGKSINSPFFLYISGVSLLFCEGFPYSQGQTQDQESHFFNTAERGIPSLPCTRKKNEVPSQLMSKRAQFFIGVALIVGAVGYLMYTSIRETSLYYLTIEEFATQKATLTNEGVRVAGRVGAGSMNWSPKDLRLQFLLSSFKEGELVQGVPVRYQGVLPDMFAEGRDVIVEGRYSHENILEASTIMTSCPSKYEAEKSGDRAQTSETGEKKTIN